MIPMGGSWVGCWARRNHSTERSAIRTKPPAYEERWLGCAGDGEGSWFEGEWIDCAADHGRDFAGYGDFCGAEHVDDLGFFQARGVVFKGQVVLGFIDAEAAQAVGVGEGTQEAELMRGERLLQLIGDF